MSVILLVVCYAADSSDVTLAFEDAQVIQPFSREETDARDDTDARDETDDTDDTDYSDDSCIRYRRYK